MRLVQASSLNRWPAPCRSVRDSSHTVPSADSTTSTIGAVLYTASTLAMVMGRTLRIRRIVVCTAPHPPQIPHHPAVSHDTAGSDWPAPHTRAAPGAAPLLAGDRNPLWAGRFTFGQP